MAAEQDRRTRMIASSVNQPAKKGGAGGSYTWGSPMDVKDFEPVGIPSGYGVVTSPVATSPTATVVSPTFQMDQAAFPAIGTGSLPVSTWGTSGVKIVSGSQPTAQFAQQAVLANNLRPGALEVIDSTHPRNTFAKKPYIRPATTTIQAAPAGDGLIDWSKAGMPEAMMKAIVTSNAGAAHLGPYQQAAPSVLPLDVLRTRNVANQAQLRQYAPTNIQQGQISSCRPNQQINKIIQQPMKR